MQLHGGPEASDRFGWGSILYNYQPAWAARGYAILRPNYRGSSGYGNAFYREPVGGYFKNSHLDVLAGVDRAIAMGVADPERLTLMGWSAGGHLVNKLITFTTRFKAASSGAGVANWISLYGQSDTRGDRDLWLGGSLWQKNAPIETYWEHSPLKYVAAARTPTLFFIGENDPRVPMSQAIELSARLEGTRRAERGAYRAQRRARLGTAATPVAQTEQRDRVVREARPAVSPTYRRPCPPKTTRTSLPTP